MGFPHFGQPFGGGGFGKPFGRGTNSLIYLIDDEFITAASAPLTSPRTCEPGPGPLTIQDTGNAWTIAQGELTPSKASVGSNNPGFWHAPGFGRVSGRTLKARVKNVSAFGADANKTFSPIIVWADVAGSGAITDFEGISYWIANSKFQILDSINTVSWISIEPCLADTYNIFAIVQRAGGGAFHIVDGKLIGVTRQNIAATPHANVCAIGSSRNPPQADYIRVADLPSPWNSDFGICTTQLPGARAAADAFIHEAACHIEFTITTLPSAGNVLIRFRVQDANNYWRFNFTSTGTVALEEVVAGTPTSRASIGSCLANDRIVASMNGAAITFYRDRPATGVTNTTAYGAALFPNNTSGDVNSLGTGGAIKDLYTYPYNLSGGALSLVNTL